MAKIEEDARAVAAVAAAEYEAAQDQTKDRSTATQSVKVENDGKTVTVEGKAKGKKNGKNGKSNKKTAKVTEAKEEKKRMSPKKQALRGALVGVAVVLLALQAGKLYQKYVTSPSSSSGASYTPTGATPSSASSKAKAPYDPLVDIPSAKENPEDGPFISLTSSYKPRAPLRPPVQVPPWAQHTAVGRQDWPGKNWDPSAANGHGHLRADVPRRSAIKRAFEHSWGAYVRDAWGEDEYWPLAKKGSNLSPTAGIGYTIIDALDSLLLMGLDEEYERARDWVRDVLDFEVEGALNTFETTIRILGGLLSAHYLASESPRYTSEKTLFLEKAVDLGDRLLGAFDSPSGLPWSSIDLADGKGIPGSGDRGLASLSEVGTLQLELKYLSHLTGDEKYWRKAEKVMAIIKRQLPQEGIAPIFISPTSGKFVPMEIRLGSRGDSYYEYLLKQYLQTDRTEPVYRDMYDQAMDGVRNLLMDRTPRQELLFTRELSPQRTAEGGMTWISTNKQDHLVCFLGGSFLLGMYEGGRKMLDWSRVPEMEHRDKLDYIAGTGLIDSCVETYNTATGLGPEIAMFRDEADVKALTESEHYSESDEWLTRDWYIKGLSTRQSDSYDARNMLRPETVESLLLAYRLTGHEKYRNAGWMIFTAFEENCKLPGGGYASIANVEKFPAQKIDKMETFWLSETLKYLYLLFDDASHIPLDTHVFNTEAHILPVFRPKALTAWSQAR